MLARVPTITPANVPMGTPPGLFTGVTSPYGPVGVPENGPVDVPTNVPLGAPVNVPLGVPANVPVGLSANVAVGVSACVPVGVSTDDVPVGVLANGPVGIPANVPVGIPANMPANVPVIMPGNVLASVPNMSAHISFPVYQSGMQFPHGQSAATLSGPNFNSLLRPTSEHQFNVPQSDYTNALIQQLQGLIMAFGATPIQANLGYNIEGIRISPHFLPLACSMLRDSIFMVAIWCQFPSIWP